VYYQKKLERKVLYIQISWQQSLAFYIFKILEEVEDKKSAAMSMRKSQYFNSVPMTVAVFVLYFIDFNFQWNAYLPCLLGINDLP